MKNRAWLSLASGLMLSLCVIGCAPSEDKKNAGKSGADLAGKAAGDDHHHDEGPHEGALADWGGKYKVEFLVDHDKKETTLYVLGPDLKTPAPIAAEVITLVIKEPAMTIECKPAPQDGEAAGSSSRFVGSNDGLGTVREFAGTISGVVEGTPYSGDFHEHAHEGHSH